VKFPTFTHKMHPTFTFLRIASSTLDYFVKKTMEVVPSDSIWFSVGGRADRLDFSVSDQSSSQARRQRCPAGTEAVALESVHTIQKY